MKPAQREAIERHGRNLLAIFPEATEKDPVKLCKRLRALENRGYTLALRLCNGPEFPGEEDADKIGDAILAKVDALLRFGLAGVPVFLNRDPRGYALKIQDNYMRTLQETTNVRLETDWGGYGIIAPEIKG